MGMDPNRQRSALRTSVASAADLQGDNEECDASAAVSALFAVNALGLAKLAYVMIGDRDTADDIVQDAFSGLYRRWEHLSDPRKALSYLRSAVLNSCRSTLRRRRPEVSGELAPLHVEHESAESVVVSEEERKVVMAALRQLPHRQREVLVLRFYLDMTEREIAAQMGVGQSTVRSSAHRGLVALGRIMREMS